MQFFDYFQIISLMVFLVIFSGRTFWLKRKGTKVFVLGKGKRGMVAFTEKSFLIFFPVWVLAILIHSLGIGNRILPVVLATPLFIHHISQIIGAALILTGLLVFSLALAAFKFSWRVGIDDETPGDLVTTGIFSLSRNPIFLSMNLYFLGTFLIHSNLFFLLCFACMALGIHFQILEEEKFLVRQYGDGYLRYMRRVRRYI